MRWRPVAVALVTLLPPARFRCGRTASAGTAVPAWSVIEEHPDAAGDAQREDDPDGDAGAVVTAAPRLRPRATSAVKSTVSV